jgi:hypothetical protein
MAYLVRSRLTQNLARLVPKLKEELEYVTATEFPECKGKRMRDRRQGYYEATN